MNLKFFLDFRNRKGGFFYQKQDGEVVLSNASAQAIRKAQSAFSGAAETMGISSEEDVQALVDEVRYGKER